MRSRRSSLFAPCRCNWLTSFRFIAGRALHQPPWGITKPTWVSKCAVLPQLSQALQHALVRSYSLSTTPTLRREAAPLPVAFILWLENEIVHERGSPLDRLLMGGVLVLVWSSLRWSDAQWIAPNDLVEDEDCIRGVATRTKSTKRGMPFGFLKSGLLGHSLSVAWSARWLNLLRQALAATEQDFVLTFSSLLAGAHMTAPLSPHLCQDPKESSL